jgi:outer membrane protein OmpA-like peptidoglycan-associated protein
MKPQRCCRSIASTVLVKTFGGYGMTLRRGLLATTLLTLPVAAMAQPVTGLYIGAGAGYDVPQYEHLRPSPGLGIRNHTKLDFDNGLAAVGSVGYGLGNGLRVELEGDYRLNYLRHRSGTPAPETGGGDQQEYGPMANVLYDFYLPRFGVNVPWLMPYLGVGAGYQFINNEGVHSTNPATATEFKSDGTSGNFAYQGIVGVAFPLEQVPGLALTAEYRFLGVLGRDAFKAGVYHPTFIARGNADISERLDHSFMLGVRYSFGQAPAAPAPAPTPVSAPTPAPSRTYLVFFDWDKATLSDRARQIISEAATNSTHVQYTRIEVNGYTDLSGTPQYNQGLSVRRAQAVAGELVRDGVPQSAIDIHGFGETHPLVPTAQGVREPQNRRVEIIIR